MLAEADLDEDASSSSKLRQRHVESVKQAESADLVGRPAAVEEVVLRGSETLRSEVPLEDVAPSTRKRLVQHARESMTDETVFKALPVCLVLFVSFTSVVVHHQENIVRQSVRAAVRDDIQENANFAYLGSMGFKNMGDVHSVADIWDWLETGFWPQVIWNSQENVTGTYLHFNRMLGGARLLKQEFPESVDHCKTSIARALGMRCVLAGDDDTASEGLDDLAFKPQGEEMRWSVGPHFNSVAKKASEWLLFNEGEAAHALRLKTMREDGWISSSVRHLQASAVFYNANVKMLGLVEANFFLARTGRVWPMLRVRVLNPSTYAPAFWAVFWDAVWLSFVLLNFFLDMRELARAAKHVGLRDLPQHMSHSMLWYVMDVVGLFCGLLLALLFGLYYYETRRLYDVVVDYAGAPDRYNIGELANIWSLTESICYWHGYRYTWVLFIYPVILLIRLVLVFTLQPRLSVPVRTIVHAAVDLYHFLVVFIVLLILFSCVAMILFGSDLEQFSTLARSLQSCVRMLFGDVDWADMQGVGNYFSMAFYWVFHIVLVLVLFNILVAVLMDAYELAREGVGADSKTLFAQAKTYVVHYWRERKGERVSQTRIYFAYYKCWAEGMFSDDEVGFEDLMSIVPGLSREQALEILEDCSKQGPVEHEASPDMLLASVRSAAKKVQQLVVPSELPAKGPSAWPPQEVSLPEFIDFPTPKGKLDIRNLEDVLRFAEAMATDQAPMMQKLIRLAVLAAQRESRVSEGPTRKLSFIQRKEASDMFIHM